MYEWTATRVAGVDDSANRFKPIKEKEFFTGYVQGKDASELEERYYQSLVRYPGIDWIQFQLIYIAPEGQTGSIELDFLVSVDNVIYPIQVDGEFAHKSASQKANDNFRDTILNNHLSGTGAQLIKRIDGVDIETPEDCDNYNREIFL
jgi:hypothetical protein